VTTQYRERINEVLFSSASGAEMVEKLDALLQQVAEESAPKACTWHKTKKKKPKNGQLVWGHWPHFPLPNTETVEFRCGEWWQGGEEVFEPTYWTEANVPPAPKEEAKS
jgi:hypothetical protein